MYSTEISFIAHPVHVNSDANLHESYLAALSPN